MATIPPIRRGDRAEIRFDIIDAAQAPLSLVGKTVWITIKKTKPSDAAEDANDASAIVKAYFVSGGGSSLLTVPTPTNGQVTLTLPSSLTTTFKPDSYVYDVQVQHGPDDIRTPDEGTISVVADVTRRVTTP